MTDGAKTVIETRADRSSASDGDHAVVVLLAGMMLLVPAVGVPGELLLQDTLKSALVSFASLSAGLLLCWQGWKRSRPLYWHPLLWLPLSLLAWALGSMVWSHTYLAGVEAVRWFIFFLVMWLGLQVLSRERLLLLANGIHWGAVMAALWAALQFWLDLRLFPQSAVPGSTFANRNFFAEFMVCTLPFSALLAAHAKGRGQVALRVFALAFSMLAVMMTGTRSALLAMLVLMMILPVILFLSRSQLALTRWTRPQQFMAAALLPLGLLGLGSVPAGNPQLLNEQDGMTALSRSGGRVQSLGQTAEYQTGSASIRLRMWQANMRMILANPLAGVGAGAWEVQIPRYQAPGMQLEEDYYAHNEPLQLVAEYGLVGWLFLLALGGYLLHAARQTWRLRHGPHAAVAPWRATALASVLALLIVSMAGFPWRLAGTGAVFALCLAILAATDLQLAQGKGTAMASGPTLRSARRASPGWWSVLAGLLSLCVVLAAWITWQAQACESRLVRAAQLARSITASGRPLDPQWEGPKADMLRLVREGISINPHYRKITTLVADELVRWGDWREAAWIWASVAQSRPYIVALLANLGRACAQADDMAGAQAYLERARALQPDAVAVRALEMDLLLHTGETARATELVRRSLAQGIYDYELLNQGYQLGLLQQDWALAIEALTRRNQGWPGMAVDGWLRIAQIHASSQVNNPTLALEAYRAALQAVPQPLRESLRQQIPQPYRKQL